MISKYVGIIDQIKEEVLSWVNDEEEDEEFILGKDFMRFKFRNDDNLVYYEKINIPVAVISLSSAIEKGCVYYPQLRLQKCFYETELS